MGDTAKAFEPTARLSKIYLLRDSFQTRRLADAVSPAIGAAFTTEAIDWLRQLGERQRYLLCQVYLSEGYFDEAYRWWPINVIRGWRKRWLPKLTCWQRLVLHRMSAWAATCAISMPK
jgi:hypothetical protein